MFGRRASELMNELTSEEWAWYQAADRVGLIPDWVRQQQLMCVAAGIDPNKLFEEDKPQDMAALYESRKRMYGYGSI